MLTEGKFHPAKILAVSNQTSGQVQVLWERGGRAQQHPDIHIIHIIPIIPIIHTGAGMGLGSRALPFPAQAACHSRRRDTHSSSSAGLLLSAQKALKEKSQLVSRAKGGSDQRGNILGVKICTDSSLRCVCTQNMDEL